MNDLDFVPFPAPMADELRRLEQAKLQLVSGFLYGAGLNGRPVRIAQDLSGVEIDPAPADSREPST